MSPWPTRLERAEIAALYERYLACCNEHRFDQLGEFVSEQVSGSGAADGLPGYIDRLKTVHTAFPDYRWDLQELVIEIVQCWGDLFPLVRDAMTGPAGVET